MLAFALQTLPFIFLPSDFGNCVASKRPYCPLASGHMSKIQVDISSIQQIRFPLRPLEDFTSP